MAEQFKANFIMNGAQLVAKLHLAASKNVESMNKEMMVINTAVVDDQAKPDENNVGKTTFLTKSGTYQVGVVALWKSENHPYAAGIDEVLAGEAKADDEQLQKEDIFIVEIDKKIQKLEKKSSSQSATATPNTKDQEQLKQLKELRSKRIKQMQKDIETSIKAYNAIKQNAFDVLVQYFKVFMGIDNIGITVNNLSTVPQYVSSQFKSPADSSKIVKNNKIVVGDKNDDNNTVSQIMKAASELKNVSYNIKDRNIVFVVDYNTSFIED